MRNKKSLLLLLLVFIATQMVAQSNRIGVHDPVAIEVNGTYYLFNTGHGIASWKSDDMKNWEFTGPVFNESPKWAKQEVPKFDGNIWAPDISYHNGKFYLFYSISSFGSNRSAMGVATNTTLDPEDEDYQWVDHGKVVESVTGRDNWNAIDPNLVFDENNEPWLSFGSFWGGLKMVKLSDDLLSIAIPQQWRNIASRLSNQNLEETNLDNTAIEAPFIFKKGEYFYLFASYDLCCRGAQSTYNVRVGRSKSATGPYIDKDGIPMMQGGGTRILEVDDNYYGIGHNSAYTFNGDDYIFSHGYEKADRGRSKLVIHKIRWDDEQWPHAEEVK